MAILEVELKQHTPMIHFQWETKGSTLRASDVKPRLDKYLGGTNRYKMTISAEIETGYPKDKSYEPYFGDYKLCLYKNIKLKYHTYFNESLRLNIEDALQKVFTLENFGSFGNKGYGGFTVVNLTQDKFEEILKDKYKTVYYWNVPSVSSADIFFHIKYFYTILKSGINVVGRNIADPTTYYKSLLMLYFKDKIHDPSNSIRWEKRGIKRDFHLTSNRNRTHNIDQTDRTIPTDEVYKAVKPLLGYSELQEWQSYSLKKDKMNPSNSNPIKIELPDNIDRIPSPLFFKIFKNGSSSIIYFMLKDENKFINKIYPNKKFNYQIKGESTHFFTPDDFNYNKFLDYAVNEINTSLVPNKASGGIARRVDDFINYLTTNKIGLL